MEGLSFGSWPSVDVVEDSGRSLSGLPPAIGPTEVGHAEILERAADINGKLAGVLPVVLDLQDDVPAVNRGAHLRLGQ